MNILAVWLFIIAMVLVIAGNWLADYYNNMHQDRYDKTSFTLLAYSRWSRVVALLGSFIAVLCSIYFIGLGLN